MERFKEVAVHSHERCTSNGRLEFVQATAPKRPDREASNILAVDTAPIVSDTGARLEDARATISAYQRST